ncbi:TPA: hypothetical protein N0F65_009091 [Lagenidium giganteum]|uniref:LAGLIDADG endonuclease n=1 Tax=Lagenidium giganteum TaxID=4803 RepID=A0AAV2YR64_9STRA|nr:TPA: hypothetical protein N0F65_009091 [Lagenidium giganteum]
MKQIKTRKQYLKTRVVRLPINCIAELVEWAGDKTCSTHEEFFGLISDTRTFANQSDKFKHELSVLRTVNVWDSRWNLQTSSRRMDIKRFRVEYVKGSYTHQFVPWAYMLTKSESTEVYVNLFDTVCSAVAGFFGINLQLKWACLDHSWPIHNALTLVWPDVKILTYWPDLIRNAREQKKRLRNQKLLVLPHIRRLH